MKILLIVSFFMIFGLISCDDSSDSQDKTCSYHSDCDDSSICYSKTCKTCPDNTIKSGDICIDQDSICNFDDTENEYKIVSNDSCNNKKGSCIRENLDTNIGFCLKDECDPTNNECGTNQKCVYNGKIYKCQDERSSTGNYCQDSSICSTEYTCFPSLAPNENETRCYQLCKPFNKYQYYTIHCQNCIDMNMFDPEYMPEIGKGVIGFCTPSADK